MFRKGFRRGSNSAGLTPAGAHRPGAGISRRSAVQWMMLYPAAHALTQQAFAQQPIRVSVNEVIVPVTVTDDKGRFVSNLDQQDFQIFDQGKLQQISYFSRERSQPVVVGFLLDLSNASRIQWKSYQGRRHGAGVEPPPRRQEVFGLSHRLRQ